MSNELALTKPDNSYLTDPQKFEHLWRVAKAFSMSSLMPDTVRGKPEDCFILAQLSMRLNVDLFMLAQNTYVVHGRPGMEAKLQIGLLNASGRIRGNIAYQFSGEGDDYGCAAVVVDAVTGEKVVGPKVTFRMVKGEKWNVDKRNERTGYVTVSKWNTMPEVMYRYRAAAMLIRAHYPEVTLGLMTREELEEQVIDVDSRLATPVVGQSKSEAIAAMVAKPEPVEPPTAQDAAEAAPRRRGRPRKAAAEPEVSEAEPAAETQQEAAVEPDEPFDSDAFAADYVRRFDRAANALELDDVKNDLNAEPAMAGLPDDAAALIADAYTRRWKQLSE